MMTFRAFIGGFSDTPRFIAFAYRADVYPVFISDARNIIQILVFGGKSFLEFHDIPRIVYLESKVS
jgi:hypothetical protein